ncbi:Pentapeptide repeat-containing protein [Andreprevotia lacus DSM 23236]|jgi:uncharacterized protein YjbI with pentapeptide repeats|uniref:Pentapeptide repeat-containing protein n=1 Tax=Andreprevotia lacus DSM 23236 TaxID=1121001 RepID=A0A1W1XZX1_9NEIS|nr:pentapeptide repeat-containing protein [Andreprevotia lacus]SMC29466.1 Pentapeptide repeat-containing protein [Andreprevotia lacus DSM 23236]
MLIESEQVTEAWQVLSYGLQEDIIFRFCVIQDFDAEGGSAGGAFLSCRFNNLDIYWGIFNCCIFSECRFENCTFRGTSFPDCKFVECEFIGCAFVQDNLGSACSFRGASWYGCVQSLSAGMPTEIPLNHQAAGAA